MGRTQREAWRDGLGLAAIVGLAAALRFVGLGRQGLWLDECSTMVWASQSFREIVAQVSADCQTPLFYSLERLVVLAFGAGEWQARLLPALAGTATVALVAVAARRLFSPAAGLVAGLLVAISPIHVHYSREARNYALLALLLVLALLAALWLQRAPSPLSASATAGTFLAALYTHDIATIYLACLVAGLAILVLRAPVTSRGRLAAWWAVALGVTGLGYLPWLRSLLDQAGRGATTYAWAQALWDDLFPWQVAASLAALSHGAPPPLTNVASVLPPASWLGAAALVALGSLGIARRKRWQVPDAWVPLVAGGVAPLLALFLYSWARAPIHVPGRADAAALPLVMLLAAGGLAVLPRPGQVAIAVVLGLLALAPLRTELTVDRKSPSSLRARALAARMHPGDVMVVTGIARHLYDYHLGRLAPGVSVRGFPSQLEAHGSWIDWAPYDDATLEREARELAAELSEAARARGAGRAWILIVRGHRGEMLARALERIALYYEHDIRPPLGEGVHCFDLTRPPGL